MRTPIPASLKVCRRLLLAAVIALSPLRPAVAAEDPHVADLDAADGQLIVHEWGTFTSFSGSDGVRMEFRPLVDSDLPGFVMDRLKQSGQSIFSKGRVIARQRMETPVTYFYTDRIRDVRVSVAMPEGLLTEFYPPVERMEPTGVLHTSTSAPFHPDLLKGSKLDWGRITLLPQAALRPAVGDEALAAEIASRAFAALPPGSDPDPELYSGDHYYFARETDSALVHVRRTPPADAAPFTMYPTGAFFEKFLFYRGVGNFDLPLTLSAPAADRFVLDNSGRDPLTGLILVQSDQTGLRFQRLQDLSAGGRLEMAAPAAPVAPHEVERQLREELQAILLKEGLYEKEAIAMLNTWSGSWFREPGTRLLYVVPRPVTDQLLPLTIEPAPQECVRVLVGRLEILPPDQERQVRQVVEASAARREARRQQADVNSPTDAAALELPEELHRLGRFAEPALQRVAVIATDGRTRAEAALLLARLRQEFTAPVPRAASGSGGQ